MSFGTDTRSPLAKLLAGPTPFVRAEVPSGRLHGAPIGLVALSADELQSAARAADKALRATASEEYLLTDAGEADLALAVKAHTVARALVMLPDDGVARAAIGYTRAVSSAEELCKLAEPDEIGFLYERFLDHQRERSPISTASTWEEVREVILAVGKGTIPTSRLSGFDSGSLRSIVAGMAKELATLTRRSSSGISPSPTSMDGAASGGDSTTITPSTSDPSPSDTSTETAQDTAQPPTPGTLSIR